jgi:protein-S-isoprenylcysteine O-methyltransferase Ste14
VDAAPADRPVPSGAERDASVAVSSTDLLGSGDLLSALGWTPSLLSFLGFSCLIAVITLGFTGVTILAGELAQVSPVIVQVFLWGIWLSWLGYLLPRHRARDVATEDNAYRRAFWRELCFGIGFHFAMLFRPLAIGLLEGGTGIESPWVLAVGLMLSGLGLYAILDASRQIGVSGAFFVYEYARGAKPRVVDRGVYGHLRHPLLIGGICTSVGLGICAGTPIAFELAAVNIIVLLPYVPIEDRRCSHALGSPYLRYREEVAGILPRARRALSAGEAVQGDNRRSQHQRGEDPAGKKRISQVGAGEARGE